MKKIFLWSITFILLALFTLPQMSSAATVYASFPGYGLWKHDGSSWSQLTPDSPQGVAVSASTLYGDFGPIGLWKWNGSSWSQLTSDNPQSMAASGPTLYAAFGGQGLWKWNGSSWSLLTPDNPENLAAFGSTLYADFGTLGLWKWNGSSWSQLTSDNPENIAVSGSTPYGDFGTLGLWVWNGSSWSQLTSDNPENIAVSGSTLYGDFGTLGLWVRNGSSWSQLTSDNPENIAVSGTMLYADFGTLGLWMWNGSSWSQLTGDNPTIFACGDSPPVVQSITGIWNGTLTSNVVHNSYSVIGIISESGMARFVNTTWLAQYSGNINTNGNNFSADATAYAPFGYVFPNRTTVGPVHLSGTFTTKGNISGIYSGVGDSGSFSVNYNSLYEMPSSLATIAGNWIGFISGYKDTLAVDSNGNITGFSTSGCTFSGHVSIIDSAYNVYAVSINMSNCGSQNGPYSGLAAITDSAKNTAVVSVSSATYSYVLSLTRQ